MEEGTRKWVAVCKCGAIQDFWETGGIRYKAIGEQSSLMPCSSCQKVSLQKIRKRLPADVVR